MSGAGSGRSGTAPGHPCSLRTPPTSLRFTGQRAEAGLGLYFYKARYMDPVLGRFTSPDSIVPNPGNPLDWDRYSYVRNNPLVYIDPTGHNPACGPDGMYCDSSGNLINLELPSLEEMNNKDTENFLTTEFNLIWYEEIRYQLLLRYGSKYVNSDGKIADFVFVAFILAMEFGETARTLSSFVDFYAAGLSAVSQQYFSNRSLWPSASTLCNGSCSQRQQIVWLQHMHAARSGNGSAASLFGANNWENFATDAERAVSAPMASSVDGKRYWSWGNYPSGKGDPGYVLTTTVSPVTRGYFEVYGYPYGWKR
jgi:RHS repeat-associated protein